MNKQSTFKKLSLMVAGIGLAGSMCVASAAGMDHNCQVTVDVSVAMLLTVPIPIVVTLKSLTPSVLAHLLCLPPPPPNKSYNSYKTIFLDVSNVCDAITFLDPSVVADNGGSADVDESNLDHPIASGGYHYYYC